MKIPYWWADSVAAVTNSAYDGFAKAINKVSGCFIDKDTAGKSSDTLQLCISLHLQDTAIACTISRH